MGPSLRARGSIALLLSYAFDWIVVILVAAVGALFDLITPYKRPFSLENPEISFPFTEHETISTAVLVVVSLIAPAVIIFFVALVFVPGPTVPKSTPTTLIWQRKLWEWFSGWLGLGVSCAFTFFITQGIKNIIGKPRPDLLSRCMPDMANLSAYVVSGFPTTPGSAQLVSAAICQQTDNSILKDGFRSFPSGHSSFSAAGLIYLSLFLASKLAITIPFLAPRTPSQERTQRAATSSYPESRKRESRTDNSSNSAKEEPSHQFDPFAFSTGHNDAEIAARNQSAAPPVYLLVFPLIPFASAIYIACSRYADFRHHGFDILFGFFIGSVVSVFAFRMYHLPIMQGAGWAWGPRSSSRAFWSGIGRGSYVSSESDHEYAMMLPKTHQDLERGNTVPGNEQGREGTL